MKRYTRQKVAVEIAAKTVQRYRQLLSQLGGPPYRRQLLADQLSSLESLGETPSLTNVNRILRRADDDGYYPCDECGSTKDIMIEMGEKPDHESRTVWLCCDCLRKAILLAEASA